MARLPALLPLGAAALAGLALAGCGSAAAGPGGSVGGPDEVLTVEQARHAPGDRPLRVRGALIARGTEATMCDALAESYPPQCPGGVRLLGFDPAVLPPGTEGDPAGNVRWTYGIELIVTRDGDAMRVVGEGS